MEIQLNAEELNTTLLPQAAAGGFRTHIADRGYIKSPRGFGVDARPLWWLVARGGREGREGMTAGDGVLAACLSLLFPHASKQEPSQ
jgi:hypothetical protein